MVQRIAESFTQFVQGWDKSFLSSPLAQELREAFHQHHQQETSFQAVQQEVADLKAQLSHAQQEKEGLLRQMQDQCTAEEDFISLLDSMEESAEMASPVSPLEDVGPVLESLRQENQRFLHENHLLQQKRKEVSAKLTQLMEASMQLTKELSESQGALSAARAQNAADARTVGELRAAVAFLEQQQLQPVASAQDLPQLLPDISEIYKSIQASLNDQ